MNEIELKLESVDPAHFWGTHNEHYELIKRAFPKLKIVARGNDIKALGDRQELNAFEHKFQELIQHLEKYCSLNPNEVEAILSVKNNKTTGYFHCRKSCVRWGGSHCLWNKWPVGKSPDGKPAENGK